MGSSHKLGRPSPLKKELAPLPRLCLGTCAAASVHKMMKVQPRRFIDGLAFFRQSSPLPCVRREGARVRSPIARYPTGASRPRAPGIGSVRAGTAGPAWLFRAYPVAPVQADREFRPDRRRKRQRAADLHRLCRAAGRHRAGVPDHRRQHRRPGPVRRRCPRAMGLVDPGRRHRIHPEPGRRLSPRFCHLHPGATLRWPARCAGRLQAGRLRPDAGLPGGGVQSGAGRGLPGLGRALRRLSHLCRPALADEEPEQAKPALYRRHYPLRALHAGHHRCRGGPSDHAGHGARPRQRCGAGGIADGARRGFVFRGRGQCGGCRRPDPGRADAAAVQRRRPRRHHHIVK